MPDLSGLSTDDLKALSGGDITKVSTDGLQHFLGQVSSPTQPAHASDVPTIYHMTSARDAALAQGDKESAAHLTDAITQRQASLNAYTAEPKPTPMQQIRAQTADYGNTGLMVGMRDPVMGITQLARHLVPDSIAGVPVGDAVDALGNKLSTMTGGFIAPSNGTQGVADINNKKLADYEAARAAKGGEGFDPARLAGNIISPVNKLLPGGAGAKTLVGIAARGTQTGAVAGLAQPVEGDQSNYWQQKLLQTGGGAAAGAVLSPLVSTLGDGVVKAATWVKKLVSNAVPVTETHVDNVLSQTLQQQGVDYKSLPAEVQMGMRNDVIKQVRGVADGTPAEVAAPKLANNATELAPFDNIDKNVKGQLKLSDAANNVAAENIIKSALPEGINFANLSPEVQGAMRQKVSSQMGKGIIKPEEIARMADITAVGATPTRGAVTRTARDFTIDKNLSKISAGGEHNPDSALGRLASLNSDNNNALVSRINTLGADGSVSNFDAGKVLIGAANASDQADKAAVSALYKKAESLNGDALSLNGKAFVDNATAALGRYSEFLPSNVKSIMTTVTKEAADGKAMTIGDKEVYRTILSQQARKAARDGDGTAQYAIGQVRNALEDVHPDNLVGKQATQAYNEANAAHAARMAKQEASPALAAAVKGVEPDDFVKNYLLAGSGSNTTAAALNALRKTVSDDPVALQAARTAIVNHLKTSAVGKGVDDGEGFAFSQAGFKSALTDIGDKKLGVFFTPEEVAQLHQLRRAASYMQAQPSGSAVNNSNTGAAVMNFALDHLKDLPIAGKFLGGARQSLEAQAVTNSLFDLSPTLASKASRAVGAGSGLGGSDVLARQLGDNSLAR